MNKRAPLPPALDPRGFSTTHAVDAGLSRARSRGSDLESLWRGARSRRQTQRTVLDQCRAYLPLLTAGLFFSHTTAAMIYRIPMPRAIEEDLRLHVTAPAGRQSPRARGIVGHRLAGDLGVRVCDGLPVCSPENAWIQLAGFLSAEDLVVAGDHLIRRKKPQSSLDQLRHAVDTAGAAKAIAKARAALNEMRSGTDSPMETKLRLLIVRNGLPEPAIGHTVHNSRGEFIGTPDLAYVRERIAIEYQGQIHQSDPDVYADDVVRREQFEDAGWRVIPVYKHHMLSRQMWAVSRVARALRERA